MTKARNTPSTSRRTPRGNYVLLSHCWYFEALRHDLASRGVYNDVIIQVLAEGRSPIGEEVVIEWAYGGPRLTAMMMSSLSTVREILDVLDVIVAHGSARIDPVTFCQRLDEHGFVDVSPLQPGRSRGNEDGRD